MIKKAEIQSDDLGLPVKPPVIKKAEIQSDDLELPVIASTRSQLDELPIKLNQIKVETLDELPIAEIKKETLDTDQQASSKTKILVRQLDSAASSTESDTFLECIEDITGSTPDVDKVMKRGIVPKIVAQLKSSK